MDLEYIKIFKNHIEKFAEIIEKKYSINKEKIYLYFIIKELYKYDTFSDENWIFLKNEKNVTIMKINKTSFKVIVL